MRGFLLFERLLALSYDMVMLVIIMFISFFGTGYLNNHYFNLNGILLWGLMIGFGFIIYFIFYIVLPLRLKGTVGKSFTELEIVPTNGKMTIGRWLFRELVLKHLVYLTIIGIVIEVIFIIINKKTIHDHYLKTTVIKKQ